MKKLMTLFAAVAIAAVSHAASINWTITNVYSPSDTTAKVAAGSMSAWLFVTANSTDVSGIPVTTLTAVQSVLESKDLSGLATLAAAHATSTSDGSIGGATGLTGFSSGSLSAFALLIDSTDLGTANNYYLVNAGADKTVSFTSSTGTKVLAFGTQATATQTAGAWTAVPEPTSGLLMLLGLAGLALKRKVA